MTNIAIILLALFMLVLFGWLAFLEYRHRRLESSFRALLGGREGENLESVLLDHVARVEHVEQVMTWLREQQPYQLQHVGVVRFNPFGDKGGDQSFAIAVLDDHTDGFVLSCLHSRVDIKVYAKPVTGGQSTYTLTPEEKDAIARAMKPRA